MRRSRLFGVEVNTKSGIKEYPKSSKSRREVPLPPHVLEALERHTHRFGRDTVVFTTITKGRSGRLLADSNWRRQTWWPAVEAAYHFGDDGEVQLVPHYPPHSIRLAGGQEESSGHRSRTATGRRRHRSSPAHAIPPAWPADPAECTRGPGAG
ncbi:hypothetical protein ABT404_11865 [Streptomyces hyaluromycini]|uniref:Tyr recombinase domain-containing protein n=1 Tax=Streptomyces hyaluromycini TaxID=1377993 RepID=A0ABV1WTR7_9ACTN